MWRSYDDFNHSTFPVAIGNPRGLYALYVQQTALDRVAHLVERLTALEKSACELDRALRSAADAAGAWPSDARHLVIEVASDGEEVLLYCEPLSGTDAATHFRAEKDLFEHWDRYPAKRLRHEVPKLIAAARELAAAARTHIREHGCQLAALTGDLAPDLRRHFKAARDLFSIEMQEMAGFAALRGLEATLREVLRKSGNTLRRDKRTPEFLADLDLFDLIEASRRLRWRGDKSPVLDRRTIALLHYLREARNAVAHPSRGGDDDAWDETITTSAKMAVGLWRVSKQGRRKALPGEISREW